MKEVNFIVNDNLYSRHPKFFVTIDFQIKAMVHENEDVEILGIGVNVGFDFLDLPIPTENGSQDERHLLAFLIEAARKHAFKV